jgi:hypothetical protein
MKRFNFSYNSSFCTFCSNLTFAILLILSLAFISCNNKNDGSDNKNTNGSDSSKKVNAHLTGDSFNPEFKILYLSNFIDPNSPDSNQLQKLIEQASVQKVVLQFYHTDQDLLTLAAYAGKQHHINFNRTYIPILNITNQSPATPVDTKGKKIYLADQEISKNGNKDPLGVLRGIINSPGYEYISFTPRLAPSPDISKYYIIYDLGYWSRNQFKDKDHVVLTPPTSLDISGNPCPPYDAY